MSDDLDHVIDEVARGMTEGTAPNDLRARVLARVDVRGLAFAARHARWLAPIAAAALIIFGVFVARERGPQNDREPEAPARQASNRPVPPAAQLVTPAAVSPERVARTRQIPRARSTSASDIDALAPPPIETPSIDFDAMTTESIAIGPLDAIDPIPVAPLATPEGERP